MQAVTAVAVQARVSEAATEEEKAQLVLRVVLVVGTCGRRGR